MVSPCLVADRKPRRVAEYRSNWLVCGVVSRGSTWLLVGIVCSGAGAPETGAPFFGLLLQPLELAEMLVGEGGGASQPQLDQVLVVEVLVVTVAVSVEVDVG